MLARIFYVKALNGDQPSKPIDFETQSENMEEACEEVFRQFTRVDGSEEISKKLEYEEIRSICVGDVVHFPNSNEREWFVADVYGFKQVPAEFAKKYLDKITFRDSTLGLDWVNQLKSMEE